MILAITILTNLYGLKERSLNIRGISIINLLPEEKKYIKKRRKPADKESCFLCGEKGHWENKCPKKKSRPHLAAFCDSIQPQWWKYLPSDEPPTGEFLYLPFDSEFSNSGSDDRLALNKFGPSSASKSSFASDSDPGSPAFEVPNLGGCNMPNSPDSPHASISSVHTYQPPEFDFSLYMLSFPKQMDLEK